MIILLNNYNSNIILVQENDSKFNKLPFLNNTKYYSQCVNRNYLHKVIIMPICNVCGEEEEKVTKCKTCGTNFCEYCGEVEAKQCIDCLDGSDDDEDSDDEQDDDLR